MKHSRNRTAGATEDNAPEPTPQLTIVRDQPTGPGGPTTLSIDEAELAKYEAGGWRRATSKEAKAIEKEAGAEA